MINDRTIEKEIRHYRDILNKKIESALYNRKNIDDEIMTEMILLSGILSSLMGKDSLELKNKQKYIYGLISKIKEVMKDLKQD